MSRDFENLVDLDGLEPALRDRLHRVHEQLVAAGPPPELTPALRDAPVGGGTVLALPARRRPVLAALAFAATVAAAAFGGGFLVGHTQRAGLKVVSVVQMQGSGPRNSLASIRVGKVDDNGNWPIEFSVTGLPELTDHAYYILMLERNGKPRYACGSFRVSNGTTTVRFTVPYRITKSSRWVVTEMSPGIHFPGHVVMTTS